MYNALNQKKYRKKVKQYNIKYNLSADDVKTVELLEAAISKSGLSANAFIKKCIAEKLERMYATL